MKKKVISLLPVYFKDKPEYFEKALNSLLNQETDILVLCDGPLTELQNTIIQKYTSKIQVHYFPYNRGLAAVLNDGIRYSLDNHYEFIARMDADDIALPDRLEKQISFLLQHPEVDIVGGAIEEIDENDQPRGKIVKYPLNHADCFHFFTKRDPLAHPAVIFRKRFFEKAGLYNVAYLKNQDTILWFEGFKKGCIFANIPDVVLKFRITDDFFKNRRSGIKRAWKMLKDRFYINKTLQYGLKSYFYAFAMFLITISPSIIKKLVYKLLR